MSYDLAFWDWPPPSDDTDATRTSTRLWQALEEGAMGVATTPAVAGLVSDLERRWPEDDEGSPWASMPIRGDAHGPLLYLALRYGRPVEEVDLIVAAARARGLVCYDPRVSQLV